MKVRIPLTLAVVCMIAFGAVLATGAKRNSRDARIRATTVDSSQANFGFAKCGRGKRAVGGGVIPLGAPSAFSVRTSGPLDASGSTLATDDGDRARQWWADGGGGPDFKVYAICSRRSDATIQATSLTVGDQGGAATARCTGRRRVTGGGIVWSGDPGVVRIISSGPLDASGSPGATRDGDRPKLWSAAVANPTGPTVLLKVYAICSRASRARVEATSMELDGLQSDSAVAYCGGRRRALGGGVVAVTPLEAVSIGASGPRDNSFTAADTGNGDRPTHWFGAVDNFSGADDRRFKVLAICG